MIRKLVLGALILSFSSLSLGINPQSGPAGDEAWKSFWNSVNVDPPPPRDFLEGDFTGKILNLTGGRLSDATVKSWILADMRRGRGDSYAGYHLRRDIADADIFGPPGLNGTSEGIDKLRAQGVERIDPDPTQRTRVAAVVWIPPEQQRANARAGFTEYAIVTGRESGMGTFVYRDGRKEPAGKPAPAGELRWQLDTGHFYRHGTLGALWYQQNGFTCIPGSAGITGEICGRVKQAADKAR